MRQILVVALLWGASAWAGKKTVVVGAGDCKDGVLLSATKDFQDLSRTQIKYDLFEPEAVLRAVRPVASRSIDDIQRQVDTARSLLYGGQNERGLELAEDALTELERASPQVKPWPITVSALVLEAQMLKNLDRAKESADAFRRVLRVEPTYKLDPDSYPPSTIQALEAVRREVMRAKRGTLQVVSTPPGASVFVDGREVGKTPFKGELPQGTYRVSLMAGEGTSFPHKVNLNREESLQVDMTFEGSVAAQPPLCVAGFVDDSAAIKLASSVAAEQVVVVRNAAVKGNPPYISGTLYDAVRAERIRNAGVRQEQLRDLMLYLFTGKPDIVATPPPPPPPAVIVAEQPPSKPSRAAPSPGDSVVSAAPALSTARVVSFVAMGVGAAVAATGIVVFAAGGADRAAYDSLKTVDGKLPDPKTAPEQNAAARSLLNPITSNQIASFGLIGVGAGAIASGLLGVLLFPAESTNIALMPTAQGAVVSLSGSF